MQEVKDKVVSHIEAEAEQWLGSAMTYTLFQSVQEHYADLICMQPDSIVDINSHSSKLKVTEETQQVYILHEVDRFTINNLLLEIIVSEFF